MTIISKELEQRLKKLELEQDDQDRTLDNLSDFEEEVHKLEAILAQLDHYLVNKKHGEEDYSHLRDLEQIEKLERKLEHIDEEYIVELEGLNNKQVNKKDSAPKGNDPQTRSAPKLNQKSAKQPSQAATLSSHGATPAVHGYVVCLMFNPESPPEWSGKGWCERGKGTRYTTLEQAKQILQRIKKQWPEYPLKIFKR